MTHRKDIEETRLYPLYMRYLESQKPDSLLPDKRYRRIIDSLDYDFSIFDSVPEISSSFIAARTVIFDTIARQHLSECPAGTIINLGSGLDFRFDRIDNGTVFWYEVDLPEVISLKNKIFTKPTRERQIGSSILEFSWIDHVSEKNNVLILAEGQFMYFAPQAVKDIFNKLSTCFNNSKIAIDILSTHKISQLIKGSTSSTGVDKLCSFLGWGMDGWHVMEKWHPGIHFLDEWYPMEMIGYRLPAGMSDILDMFPWVKDQSKIGLLALGSFKKTDQLNEIELSGATIRRNHRMVKSQEILDDIFKNNDWRFL